MMISSGKNPFFMKFLQVIAKDFHSNCRKYFLHKFVGIHCLLVLVGLYAKLTQNALVTKSSH